MLPGIAILGALVAVSRRMAPTGNTAVDIVYSVALGAGVAICGGWCPWWLLAGSAALGAFLAPNIVVGIVAAAAGIAATFFVRRTPTARPGRALVTVALVAVFTRLRAPHFLGGPSLVAGANFAVVIAIGVLRGRWRHRRVVVIVGVIAGAVTGASTVLLALGGYASRADLNLGKDAAQRALDNVQAGRLPEARSELTAAARAFTAVDRRLRTWTTAPAALVPVVAQHRRMLTELTRSGTAITRRVEEALATIDLDALKPVGGRIDLAAVAKTTPALEASENAIVGLDATLTAALADPWIAAPLRRRLEPLATRVAKAARDGDTAVLAAKSGFTLLGGSGDRHYLVLFVTPSEARGLGGYAGNFAELSAVDGQLALARFGRIGDLILKDSPTSIRLTGPPGWKDSWARFGGIAPSTGTMLADYWQLVTQPPDLSDVGRLVAEMYPQTGGRTIDGVIVVDPQGLASLLQLTGPVNVASIGRPLDAGSAAGFLLRDQYRQFNTNDTRIDALQEVAIATTAKLIGNAGALPRPTDMAKILSPAARAGHLTMWSSHAEEQTLLVRVGASNTLPAVRGDTLAVTTQNTSGTKLEAFLTRTIDYRAIINRETGAMTATIDVTLRNDATPTGLPPYVYGAKPLKGLTAYGESELYVTVYTAYPVTSATVNGVPTATLHWREHDRDATTLYVRTLAGATSSVHFAGAGTLPRRPDYVLDVRAQTSATTPDRYRITVSDTQGILLNADDRIEGVRAYRARVR